MSLLNDIRRMLVFREPKPPLFELIDEKEAEKGRRGQDIDSDGNEDKSKKKDKDKGKDSKTGESRTEGKKDRKKPDSGRERRTNRKAVRKAGQEELLAAEVYVNDKVDLHYDLETKKRVLELVFRKPKNIDIVFREFTVNSEPPLKAMLAFYDGLVDRNVQNLAILQPLMLLSGLRLDREAAGPLEAFAGRTMPGNQMTFADTYKETIEGILAGSTAVLFDHSARAALVETKGWDHRGVQKPENEVVVRGPQEAFTETFRTNTGLIRKALHTPDLVTEMVRVGTVSRTIVGVMYLETIANPELVKEVMRRLKSVKTDFLTDSGMLEQLLEDHPYAPTPLLLATERPDRVVANLAAGQVALVMDNSPYVLLAPATFFSLFQTGEDAYLRWPLGFTVRTVRLLGLLAATFLPAFFIAVVTFHHEMIPTDLLLSIAGNRELVPFPTIVELLLMEVAFELIREAGIRIPGVIGTTLGIVGALILGQAAVAANIVSPVTIIVVAVTAIGGFTIPNFSLAYTVRVLRFIYVFLAGFLGMFGIVLGMYVQFAYLVSLKSFGVPYFAPISPTTRSAPDRFMRGHVWSMESRPDYLNPGQEKRQPQISRGWVKKYRRQGGKNGKDGGGNERQG